MGPTSNGVYYLAITRSANGPVSNTGEIFTGNMIGAVAGPDLTAGGGGAVTGFDNGVNTETDFDNVNYHILLGGTVPEPATWTLMCAAAITLLLIRRKLAAN